MKPVFATVMACGITILIAHTQAKAQSMPESSTSTYGELSSLTSQIAILKAQAEVASLQQQIAETKKNTGNLAEQGGAVPQPPSARVNNLPQVLFISGRGQHLNALLLMPGGGEVEVKPGTPLGNGIVVQSLSMDSVYITQNGYFFALPFANSSMSNSAYTPGG